MFLSVFLIFLRRRCHDAREETSPTPVGRGKGNVSQIQGHLCDKTADELLTELEARMDEMTDLTYDEDVIDSYLAALDKKSSSRKKILMWNGHGKSSVHSMRFYSTRTFCQTGGSPKRISWIPFPQSLRKSCRCCGHRRRIHYVLCTGRWHRRVWCNRAMDGGDIPLCCPGRPCNFRGFRSSR